MGLAVADCEKALQILDKKFRRVRGASGVEVAVENASGTADMVRALNEKGSHGMDYRPVGCRIERSTSEKEIGISDVTATSCPTGASKIRMERACSIRRGKAF